MWGLFAAITAVRFGLAAHWELLADEAWYSVWADHLALGFYDQPPGIAWAVAASTGVFGDAPLAHRLFPLLCSLIVPLVLLRWAGSRDRWLLWCALVPAVAWLGSFATPDALLLGAWALGMAGALHGGRGWWVAGVAAGLAFEAKHTGALLLPLLWVACRPSPRDRDPWIGAALALALALPNVAWLAGHDWVTVRFQLREGLLHPRTPGAVGLPLQVAGQLAVVTPILGVAGYAWVAARARQALTGTDPILRVAWWTSAPLLALFAVAAGFAPGDAHWTAPAWIGVGLGISRERGAWERGSWLGIGLAGMAVGFLALHTVVGVLAWPRDPATQLTEGPVLGGMVARVVAAETGEGTDGPPLVVTERYQEAGLIAHSTPYVAAVHPGCGRPGQQDLWPDPTVGAERAVFVRPSTGGPPDCVLDRWTVVSGPHRLEGADPRGARVGPWDLFVLEAR